MVLYPMYVLVLYWFTWHLKGLTMFLGYAYRISGVPMGGMGLRIPNV